MEKSNSPSGLLNLGPYDAANDMDRAWTAYFVSLEGLISSGTDSETNSTLQAKVSGSRHAYAEVSLGLVYGMLTDVGKASQYLNYLMMVTRDGYALCTKEVTRLVQEHFPEFHDPVRLQILWLTDHFLQLDATETEGVITALIRQVAGGRGSLLSNMKLGKGLLEVLYKHIAWVKKRPMVLAHAVYSGLRLLLDAAAVPQGASGSPAAAAFRQQGCILVTQLLSECHVECLVIGRDLVRQLYDTSKAWIPSTVINNPSLH
ncbi:hypothetical protein CYMTET_32706 [Cymbomonas tetramitiformis]|uniref:Integrator complex subunit 3 N-terminal domain-containing protein n=1 Tax=Cymbomonas tetramitiformis TaxID=36881 RepID=A0AAE0KRY8_9CHLO|nr:hypothetical protein CYMTET_32706 [Cymbomonas tetramitiformis]